MTLRTITCSVQGVEKSQGIEFETSSGVLHNIGVFTLLGTTKTYHFLAHFTPYQILVHGRPYSQLTRPEQEQLTANLAHKRFEVKSGKFLIS